MLEIFNPTSKIDIGKEKRAWICFDLAEPFIDLEYYVELGFSIPYLAVKSPSGKTIPLSLCLIYRKEIQTDPNETLNRIKYVLEHAKEASCCLWGTFSEDALEFLRTAYLKGKKGKNDQGEISGALYTEKTEVVDGKVLHIVDVEKKSVKVGGQEDSLVYPSMYNFHSHPENAYIKYSVEKAWPSMIDYLGYLQLGKDTIFHCVATKEGLYIISFGKHWVKNLKKVSKKFIEEKYSINYKSSITPHEYCEHINSINFEGYPIFKVQYFPWNKEIVFKIDYSKSGMNCFSFPSDLEVYKKIH